MRYAGIEAGGTKFVCGVGTGPEDLHSVEVPTGTAEETIERALRFFSEWDTGELRALGIGGFGPLDLNPESLTFGYITSTPKPGWRDFNLAGELCRRMNLPVAIDTDVNAALLGEARWGAAQGVADAVYITVGTGIGGGALVNGQLVHGLMHPEMGHVLTPHDVSADPFPGICPYHGDCLEGLASGPAIQARWGCPAENLPPEHPAWELEARYLAAGLANWAYTLSPRRIVLGGGVLRQEQLLPLIRRNLCEILKGYLPRLDGMEAIEETVLPAQLGDRAGVLGALVLAETADA